MSEDSHNSSDRTKPGHGPEVSPISERWRDQSSKRIRVTALSDGHSEYTASLRPLDDLEEEGTNPDLRPRVAFGMTMPAPLADDTSERDAGAPVLGRLRKRKEGPPLPANGDLIADRYRVVRTLGVGGMGHVFEVAHVRLGKSFALKLLRPELAKDRSMRSAFFREAKYASSMDHPNLISVLDYGQDDQHGAYIVMELAVGRLLSEFLNKKGKLSLRRSCDIALQVAEALAHIHEQDLIHCDLKPQNIMLIPVSGGTRRRFSVRVLDFGLAQSQVVNHGDRIYGTPAYISPEVARQEPASEASDVYALGILFFQMLTGTTPWKGETRKVLQAHIFSEPPSISEVRGEPVDEALEQMVSTALKKYPEERQRNMSAFIYELKNVMQMVGLRKAHRGANGTGVKDNPLDPRLQLATAAFESTRVPLATISQDGTIVVANAAFSKFVLGMRTGVERTKLQTSNLAPAWETLEADLVTACGGIAQGRRVEIEQDHGSPIRLQMWLEPAGRKGYAVLTLYPGL